MTKEEAIEVLSGFKVVGMRNGKTQLYQALYLAIAALREQCVRDATKTSDWISVEERLPERDTAVLCLDHDGGMFVGVDWLDWPSGGVTFKQYKSAFWPRASHWMPLPEPPAVEL